MHATRTRSVGTLARLALAIACVAGGCSNGGTWSAREHDPTLQAQLSADAPSPSTPFEPVAIRVHPLTRRVDPLGAPPMQSASSDGRGRTDLEVRVECLDRDGIETRAVGLLWLELTSNGTRLTVGPIDLSDRDLNLQTFETITRTYRVSVRMPDAAIPAADGIVEIDAFLRLPSGPLLRDRHELRWR